MFGNDHEEKLRKKRGGAIRTSIWSAGLGIGLLIIRYIAPLMMGESAAANAGFSAFGYVLAGYGLAQLAILALLPRVALKLCFAITYLVMPAILLKIIMDMQG